MTRYGLVPPLSCVSISLNYLRKLYPQRSSPGQATVTSLSYLSLIGLMNRPPLELYLHQADGDDEEAKAQRGEGMHLRASQLAGGRTHRSSRLKGCHGD